jgi:hypothetical protein
LPKEQLRIVPCTEVVRAVNIGWDVIKVLDPNRNFVFHIVDKLRTVIILLTTRRTRMDWHNHWQHIHQAVFVNLRGATSVLAVLKLHIAKLMEVVPDANTMVATKVPKVVHPFASVTEVGGVANTAVTVIKVQKARLGFAKDTEEDIVANKMDVWTEHVGVRHLVLLMEVVRDVGIR